MVREALVLYRLLAYSSYTKILLISLLAKNKVQSLTAGHNPMMLDILKYSSVTQRNYSPPRMKIKERKAP